MEKLAGFEAANIVANIVAGKKKAVRKKKPAAARDNAEVRFSGALLLDTGFCSLY